MQPNYPARSMCNVGAQIRMRRKSLGMSQSALAGRLGITFSRCRNTRRAPIASALPWLQAIASILGVDVSSLFANATPDVGSNSAALGTINAMQSFVASNEGFALNQPSPASRARPFAEALLRFVTSLAVSETTENNAASMIRTDD